MNGLPPLTERRLSKPVNPDPIGEKQSLPLWGPGLRSADTLLSKLTHTNIRASQKKTISKLGAEKFEEMYDFETVLSCTCPSFRVAGGIVSRS
jgi:hypothetical protein